jgi:tetratricopeptide (TPR) repeat protein
MKTDLKWGQNLEDEANIRAILLGDAELPPFTGQSDSQGYYFHQTVLAIIDLYRGDFDAAGLKLNVIGTAAPSLQCTRLAMLWHEAETGDPVNAWQKLNIWMDQAPVIGKSLIDNLIRPLNALDRRLAWRWAPVLRYYLTTLLTEWPAEIQDQNRQDRLAAQNNGISESTLVRIDFLLRFARARQEKSVSQIIEAAEEWQNLCNQDPLYGDGTEYILEAVVALEYDDRFAEALAWLARGLELEPELYDLLLVKARILKRIGEVKECLAVCDRLIELYPEDFSGYCLRSNTYFLMGWYERAMADAKKAVDVAPENPNSFMARAFVQMQLGRYEEALRDFEQTLQYDPHRYDALRGQGKCLSMLGHDYEALASFNALRRNYPDDPDLYYELADVLFSAGYLEDCEKVCHKCLQLDNDYVNAYVILGMIAMRKNDDDKAHQLLTKAVKMEPDNPFGLNELAYLTHLQGDDDLALELVNRALEEAPEYADALCNKGVILYFRSEFEQSAAIFEDTLRLVPDHVAAMVGKGNTLTQLCDFDEAQQCYDQALALDPENADACHGKAVLYRMLGLDDEVRKWQEKAYALDHEDED